jgi:hypothetical protein
MIFRSDNRQLVLEDIMDTCAFVGVANAEAWPGQCGENVVPRMVNGVANRQGADAAGSGIAKNVGRDLGARFPVPSGTWSAFSQRKNIRRIGV